MLLDVQHRGERPGPGWHAHGITAKLLIVVNDGALLTLRLAKQRWLHVDTGTTTHDRPVWDRPRARYALDVVVVALATWLFSDHGLHNTDWPWNDDRPSTRTVQRRRRALRPHAESWLQHSRLRFLDYVAPRTLEDLLPAGGIPPPEGVRKQAPVKRVANASKLRDVLGMHRSLAQGLCIPFRKLLVVARWRWPSERPSQQPS
jgi:hypothetical protein